MGITIWKRDKFSIKIQEYVGFYMQGFRIDKIISLGFRDIVFYGRPRKKKP